MDSFSFSLPFIQLNITSLGVGGHVMFLLVYQMANILWNTKIFTKCDTIHYIHIFKSPSKCARTKITIIGWKLSWHRFINIHNIISPVTSDEKKPKWIRHDHAQHREFLSFHIHWWLLFECERCTVYAFPSLDWVHFLCISNIHPIRSICNIVQNDSRCTQDVENLFHRSLHQRIPYILK